MKDQSKIEAALLWVNNHGEKPEGFPSHFLSKKEGKDLLSLRAYVSNILHWVME